MKYTPKIPAARELLLEVLEMNLDSKARVKIEKALQLMYREKHKPEKAPAKAVRMTAEIRDKIKEFTANNPNVGVREMSRVFGVNAGRISEVYAGKYDYL